ncbi:MAG: DUF882 domain-containing protein [Chthoniobacterales bacterium]|nr:DUF882 domain-containing protein [Chthoniobacterales bacterium]
MEYQLIAIPRRRLMGLILCAGAGLLAGAGKADAMWSVLDVLNGLNGESQEKPDRSTLPPSLRGVLGYNNEAYRKFLARMGLRKISVQQIMDSHAKAHGKIHNSLPPRQLWGNIRSTLLAVDKVCARLGEPVGEVLSVYRSPAYNATCPGAKSHSYHLRNNAIDMRFRSSPRKVAAMARDLRKAGLFKGGVGRYSSFTHMDTRGSNADW